MKTKKLTITVVALIAAFNLTTFVIIITNGYKTIKAQKALITKENNQRFISSLIY